MNSQEINDNFFTFESENSLFSKKIQGIFFWELVRFEVSRKILIQKGIITEPHQKVNNKLIYILKNFGLLFYNSVIANPIFSGSNKIFILGHSRRQYINNEYVDIYTDFIKQNLFNLNISFQDFESLNFSRKYKKYFSKVSKNILFFDIFEGFAILFSRGIKISDEENLYLKNINSKINNLYKINIDLHKIVKTKLAYFKFLNKCFYLLFKWKKPKLILEVVGYSITNMSLNYAAKKLSIKTIELQHGVIDKYHVGYSMGDNKNIKTKYFPDYIFTWGKYWNTVCNYPSNCQLIDLGFPFFDFNKSNIKLQANNNTKNILVISQGAIGEALANKVFDLSQSLSDYTFYYKLHPGEFHKLKNELSFLKNNKNINIIQGEKTIYELFSICNIQIGVFSTAVYEGLGFGLKTIVYNLPGVEYLNNLIEIGIVKKVNDTTECTHVIKNGDFNNSLFNSSDFFKENSLDNISEEIKNLSSNS